MSDVEGDEPMAVDAPAAAATSGTMDINTAIQVSVMHNSLFFVRDGGAK
jgi:hypothetical protein